MSRPSLTKENAKFRLGQGDWAPFDLEMSLVEEAGQKWASQLAGIERPWLCWNMSPAWCLVQQKLVKHVGWTPVVGLDPKYEAPALVDGAIQVDFNDGLHLPQMYAIFPVEFAWMFAPRLAFWHSDLLCRLSFMEEVAAVFEKLVDGEMAAVWDYGGRRHLLNFKMHRYYELLGCMTRGASKSNFDAGCGWWRNSFLHPNVGSQAERDEREKLFYDNGFGIMYWKRKHSGRVRNLSLWRAAEGHCSEIGNKNYKNLPDHYEATRNTGKEMELNYDLEQVCKRLGIARFL
jgi:hypothetical protein